MVQGTFSYLAQSVLVLGLMTQRGEAPSPDAQPIALVNVPLFHVTGEVPLMLQSFALGRKLVLMPKWDVVTAMQLIERERVTYFVGVPLMSFEIATHPDHDKYDLSSCVTFAAGGAPRPVEHVDRIRKALPHAFPILGYGLTETNGVGCGNFNENYLAKPGSTGTSRSIRLLLRGRRIWCTSPGVHASIAASLSERASGSVRPGEVRRMIHIAAVAALSIARPFPVVTVSIPVPVISVFRRSAGTASSRHASRARQSPPSRPADAGSRSCPGRTGSAPRSSGRRRS